jgi:hypothetical protein
VSFAHVSPISSCYLRRNSSWLVFRVVIFFEPSPIKGGDDIPSTGSLGRHLIAIGGTEARYVDKPAAEGFSAIDAPAKIGDLERPYKAFASPIDIGPVVQSSAAVLVHRRKTEGLSYNMLSDIDLFAARRPSPD